MMIMQAIKSNFMVALLLMLLLQIDSFGQDDNCIPEKPKNENFLVHDLANVLSSRESTSLNKKLVNFAKESSNHILVLTVNDLCDFSPNQFAYKVGDLWGVGQADEDNGVVFLIKNKTKDSKGEIYIAPGRGLEGAIPDLLASRIIEEVIIPHFKTGNLAKGINEGVDDIMLLAKGEYNEEVELGNDATKEIGFFFLFFFILILVIVITTHRKVSNYATINNIGFWTAYHLLNKQSIGRNGMPNTRNRGSRGGYIGGFPSRGGGGMGGFGGFGGGSFGGGGAGGSW
ncbi:MAG: hypothetical protein ACI8XB_000569 [Patiriisocius sp.]|jgi:uncharacterized protein